MPSGIVSPWVQFRDLRVFPYNLLFLHPFYLLSDFIMLCKGCLQEQNQASSLRTEKGSWNRIKMLKSYGLSYQFETHSKRQRERNGAGYTLRIGCKDHTAQVLFYALSACPVSFCYISRCCGYKDQVGV